MVYQAPLYGAKPSQMLEGMNDIGCSLQSSFEQQKQQWQWLAGPQPLPPQHQAPSYATEPKRPLGSSPKLLQQQQRQKQKQGQAPSYAAEPKWPLVSSPQQQRQLSFTVCPQLLLADRSPLTSQHQPLLPVIDYIRSAWMIHTHPSHSMAPARCQTMASSCSSDPSTDPSLPSASCYAGTSRPLPLPLASDFMALVQNLARASYYSADPCTDPSLPLPCCDASTSSGALSPDTIEEILQVERPRGSGISRRQFSIYDNGHWTLEEVMSREEIIEELFPQPPPEQQKHQHSALQ